MTGARVDRLYDDPLARHSLDHPIMRYLVAAILIVAGVVGYGSYQKREVREREAAEAARLAAQESARADSVRMAAEADSIRAAQYQRTADAVAAAAAARSDAPRPVTIPRERKVVVRSPGATNRSP